MKRIIFTCILTLMLILPFNIKADPVSSVSSDDDLKTENSELDNNNLKDLAISGYSIEFSKDKRTYEISIKENINSLEIKAIPEADKATVEIVGADDLKANDGKVNITVKAENGDTTTYTIVTHEEEKVVIAEPEKEGFKPTKEQMTIAGIIIGAIVFIIFMILLVRHICDRKIDKNLKSL